jgi:hypothetical protein
MLLIFDTSYKGEEQGVLVPSKEDSAEPVPVRRVVIKLRNGRTTSISVEQ